MRRLVPIVIASLPIALAGAQVRPTSNKALSLSAGGTDTHIDLPYAPVPTNGFTLEAWITYDDSLPVGQGDYWPTVCRMNPNPGAHSFLLRVRGSSVNGRALDFVVRTTTGTQRLDYYFAPGEFLTWTHIACTWDGTAQRMFINGQQARSRAITPQPMLDTGGVLRVGNGDTSRPGREVWNGEIDELRLWPFPRTPTEIVETMNQELHGMPGGVTTLNLNGNCYDSSRRTVGTPSTPLAYSASPIALEPVPGLAAPFGPETTTCPPGPTLAMGSPALVGNQAFAFHGNHVPPNTVGALALGTLRAWIPISLYGINLNLDPTGIFATAGMISGASSQTRFALPLPNDQGMRRSHLKAQWAFLDGGCGPFGLVASSGLEFTVQ